MGRRGDGAGAKDRLVRSITSKLGGVEEDLKLVLVEGGEVVVDLELERLDGGYYDFACSVEEGDVVALGGLGVVGVDIVESEFGEVVRHVGTTA